MATVGAQRAPQAQRGGGAVAPARRCAHAVLRRVDERGAYADRALHAEAARFALAPRDRSLATRLAYETVQRRATLDWLIDRLCTRGAAELSPPVHAALRLGLVQLVFLDGIPPHAAVADAVELAKQGPPGAARLVNAVLRRAAREARALVAGIDDSTPAGAALAHSHPEWLVRRWWEELGADHARALLAADNAPAETALRVNTLRTEVDELAAELARAGVPTRRCPELPEGLLVDGPFDAHGSAAWQRGALMPQSRAAMLVARLLDPVPGERVLDLCAAPGAKTTHLAALMQGRGEIVAIERHGGRASALQATCRRMGADNVVVRVQDAAAPIADGPFDRVLLDPPCSGLGTLRSRPDQRWRVTPADVRTLARQQRRLLTAAASQLRAGGVLVYAVCTISRAEGDLLIERFLAEHADFTADELSNDLPLWHHPSVPGHLQLLPHRDGTDGFFIARLRREGDARRRDEDARLRRAGDRTA